MAAFQLAVIKIDRSWTILHDSLPLGRYRSRTRAIDAAYRLASDADKLGDAVELLVQDFGGEVLAVPLLQSDGRSPSAARA